jgi:hypothetical protein
MTAPPICGAWRCDSGTAARGMAGATRGVRTELGSGPGSLKEARSGGAAVRPVRALVSRATRRASCLFEPRFFCAKFLGGLAARAGNVGSAL